MANTRYKFEEWLPDQPAIAGQLLEAKNVYPVSIGYAPFNSAEDYSNSASENLNSVFVGKFGDEVQLFAGSEGELYQFNSTNLNMTAVSKVGGYSGSHYWKFAQFGKVVLATNNSQPIQAWTIGTSASFADLSASAPTAKYVTVVRDFVVAANIGSSEPQKVIWSDINDETNWVSGSTSQSDYQLIADGGNITGITGGEIGLVFLEKAIVRMSYVGSPLFFQFDVISRGLGCFAGNSIAQYGATSFFLADDGFYQCDGNTVTGIGVEKIDRFFFNDCDLTDLDTMSAAIDPIKKLVVWNYANVDGGRSILVYNFKLNKWSRVETDTTVVGNAATSGVTLEGLAALYPSIETIPASLDDRLWVGGKFLFAGARDDKIVTFTGSNYDSEIITSDIETGYNSVVSLVRPQIDNGSANISVSSRRELNDNIAFGSSVTTSEEGRANFRSAGRYHRFKVEPTGNWTNAISLDVDVKPQGNR
jgi:hypothetical protein